MQTLPPAESRKILDAMSIPVVVLRDRSDKTEVVESDPSISALTPKKPSSDLMKVLAEGSPSSSETASAEDQTAESFQENAPAKSSSVSPDFQAPLAVAKPLRFTLVSAVSADTLLACELPEWAGGLLEGRLTGLCSDLLRALSPSAQEADWQYFHWPIAGVKDHSHEAALGALDAWLHRRWAETTSTNPVIALAVSQIDLSSIFSDAWVLPSLGELAVSSDAKRSAWGVIKERAHG